MLSGPGHADDGLPLANLVKLSGVAERVHEKTFRLEISVRRSASNLTVRGEGEENTPMAASPPAYCRTPAAGL